MCLNTVLSPLQFVSPELRIHSADKRGMDRKLFLFFHPRLIGNID